MELTDKEKAKAYDKIVNKLSKFIQQGIESLITRKSVQDFFPELAESEDKDERIRKELIRAFQSLNTIKVWNGIERIDILAWLEKQGETDKASYEIAEEEKYDFVSGQFIECRKSFNEFKENNSYWFEYVGNDTYIGRSDNILNKKFHITPRQLYRLFTQQHCPKENNINEVAYII